MILHEAMRQSGSDNREFVELLQRLRDGCCNDEDCRLLMSRRLSPLTLPKDDGGWRFAPVIVSSNGTRDAVNRRAAEAFAEQVGKQFKVALVPRV